MARSTIDAQAMMNKMESAGNGSNIVILDARRNNPLARSFRSSQQGLAQMDAPVGTLVAYATAPGAVAFDGLRNQRNGPYTTHLLDAIRQRDLKVEEVFKQVRNAVLRASNNRQIPWEASALVGDFCFHPPAAGGAAPTVAAAAAAPLPLLEVARHGIGIALPFGTTVRTRDARQPDRTGRGLIAAIVRHACLDAFARPTFRCQALTRRPTTSPGCTTGRRGERQSSCSRGQLGRRAGPFIRRSGGIGHARAMLPTASPSIGRARAAAWWRRLAPAGLTGALIAALIALTAPLAWGHDHDQDRVRDAVRAGEVMPFDALRERLRKSQPGDVLELELEREHGRWIYEIKLLRPDGRIVRLEVDAHSGAVLRERPGKRQR